MYNLRSSHGHLSKATVTRVESMTLGSVVAKVEPVVMPRVALTALE